MFSNFTKLQSKLYVEMLVFHTHIIVLKIQKKNENLQSNNKQVGRKIQDKSLVLWNVFKLKLRFVFLVILLLLL